MPYGTQLLLQIHVFLYSYRKHSGYDICNRIFVGELVASGSDFLWLHDNHCGYSHQTKQTKSNRVYIAMAKYSQLLMCGKCMNVYVNRRVYIYRSLSTYIYTEIQACILATMERGVKVGIMACVFFIISGCFSIPTIIYIIHSGSQDHHHITTARDILYRLNVNDCPQKVRIGIHVQLNLIAS